MTVRKSHRNKSKNSTNVSTDVDGLIAAYNGDTKALIATLLAERQMLIRQIELAAAAMSGGFVRGWKPMMPNER